MMTVSKISRQITDQFHYERVHEYGIATHGFNPESLLTDPAKVTERLHAILNDKLLLFNPYKVSDEALLDCCGRARFLPFPALTQMVVLHFIKVVPNMSARSGTNIIYRVGGDEKECMMQINDLRSKFTYRATRSQEWNLVNGRRITNHSTVEKLTGKSFFVSHILWGDAINGCTRPIFRMFRLQGDDKNKADEIRKRMCEAKLIMLQEVLEHPYSPDYLRCCRNFIDYHTPINAFMEAVKHFPEVRTRR